MPSARRAQAAVDLDQAALADLDAGGVEPERLDVGPAAGGDDEVVGLGRLAVVGEGDLVVLRLDVLDQRAGVDLHALLGQPAAGELGDVGVLEREDAVDRLEQRDLGAEPRVGGRDLGAGRAGADDGQRAGQLLERPRLLRADHAAAELGAGDRQRDGAGGEHDALRRLELLVADRDGLAAAQRAPRPRCTRSSFFLNRPATPPVSVLMTFLRRSETLPKSTVRDGDLDAELAGLVDLGEDVGDAQDRLGRDARVVEAAAADGVLLHDRRLHPELGRPDRRDVATGTRADDDAVVRSQPWRSTLSARGA